MQNTHKAEIIDPWLASSLLQKSIRRGDFETALFAARSFYRHRGQGIFRRLSLCCFEDIGVADLKLVQYVTMLAVDKNYRQSIGSDEQLIYSTVQSMASAAKDRSTDHLLSLAQSSRELDDFREWCFGQSPAALSAIAVDAWVPIEKRAVALWCAVASGPSLAFSRGESLAVLLDAFLAAGLPSAITETALVGVNLIKEPIVLMLPIIAHTIQQLGMQTSIIQEQAPTVRLCQGVPTYCADRHTATGKAALRRFLTECHPVDEVVSKWVADRNAVEVVGYALFHVEGWVITNRLNWDQGRSLQHLGTHVDLIKSGCAPEGVDDVLAVVRANLDHLDAIRCRLLERKPKPPQQLDLLDGEA